MNCKNDYSACKFIMRVRMRLLRTASSKTAPLPTTMANVREQI